MQGLARGIESQETVVGVEIDSKPPLLPGLRHADDLVYREEPLVYGLVHDGLDRSLSGEPRSPDPHALDDEPVLPPDVELPGQGADGLEELVEVEGPESARLDEDALRGPQAEVGAHEGGGGLLGRAEAEAHPPGLPTLDREAYPLDLVLAYLLEPERADGQAVFR